jgi:hypothetical protein
LAAVLERAENHWKRQVDIAVVHYSTWGTSGPRSSKFEWLMYSGKLGDDAFVAEHVWNNKGKANYAVPDLPTPAGNPGQNAPYAR